MKSKVVLTNRKTGGKFVIDICDFERNAKLIKNMKKVDFSATQKYGIGKKYPTVISTNSEQETITEIMKLFDNKCIGFNNFMSAPKNQLRKQGDCLKTAGDHSNPYTGYMLFKHTNKYGKTFYNATPHDFNVIHTSRGLSVKEYSDLIYDKSEITLLGYIGIPRQNKIKGYS